jgi:hypothetical protein
LSRSAIALINPPLPAVSLPRINTSMRGARMLQPAGQIVQLDLHRFEQVFVLFLFEFVHAG